MCETCDDAERIEVALRERADPLSIEAADLLRSLVAERIDAIAEANDW